MNSPNVPGECAHEVGRLKDKSECDLQGRKVWTNCRVAGECVWASCKPLTKVEREAEEDGDDDED